MQIGSIVKPVHCEYPRYVSSLRIPWLLLERLPTPSCSSFTHVRHDPYPERHAVFCAFAKLVRHILHLTVKCTVNPVRLSEHSKRFDCKLRAQSSLWRMFCRVTLYVRMYVNTYAFLILISELEIKYNITKVMNKSKITRERTWNNNMRNT